MNELPSRHPDALLEENARLKAEVERLTKAGDDLADAFYQMSKSRPNFYSNTYAYWFAAKEGNGQS
jgi:hypothetical protein